jgi:4-hydroxy-4-methyl-2-oxoglutarate aldolase
LGADHSAPANLSSATLHEAGGRIGAFPCAIRPLDKGLRLRGPAFPVRCGPGSNLALHHAIYAARPGDVLVADVGEGRDFGYWGEVMTRAAIVRELAGLVINGGVRDVTAIAAAGFPVFSSAISLRGTGKDPAGTIGEPICIGDVTVRRGDLVVGDADGVVVIPASQADEIEQRAAARDADEAVYFDRLLAGETTIGIYGLPPLREAPPQGGRRSINVSGLDHGDLPIPAASRVGPLLATGGVRGVDRSTGKVPETPAEQCELMFGNLRAIVEAAGGRVENIVKLTVWISAPETRALLNPPWLAMFPDPASRPSRHIICQVLPGGMAVQCEALAFLDPLSRGGAAHA